MQNQRGTGYDYENRLVEIRDGGDGLVARYAYDALGRRIVKDDAGAGAALGRCR